MYNLTALNVLYPRFSAGIFFKNSFGCLNCLTIFAFHFKADKMKFKKKVSWWRRLLNFLFMKWIKNPAPPPTPFDAAQNTGDADVLKKDLSSFDGSPSLEGILDHLADGTVDIPTASGTVNVGVNDQYITNDGTAWVVTPKDEFEAANQPYTAPASEPPVQSDATETESAAS